MARWAMGKEASHRILDYCVLEVAQKYDDGTSPKKVSIEKDRRRSIGQDRRGLARLEWGLIEIISSYKFQKGSKHFKDTP